MPIPTDAEIEEQDVRDYMGEIETAEIPSTTMQLAVEYAEDEVLDALPEDEDEYPTDARIKHAQLAVAAEEAFMSTPPVKQDAALDASTTWDVAAYVEWLTERADEKLGAIGAPAGGRSAGFVVITDGVFDDE